MSATQAQQAFSIHPSAEEALDGLHAQVWRAHAWARAPLHTVATGEALLDAQLPGGGWPVGALTELLQEAGVHNEWRVLLPALAQHGSGPVVLVGPPHPPFAPALLAQGLQTQRLLCLCPGAFAMDTAQKATPPLAPASCLWATEQALRCAPVDTVVAWLAQVRPHQLRRLQLAAAEHHKLLFVVRSLQTQHEASPAVLRLKLSLNVQSHVCVEVLKRRGPPAADLVQWAARPTALQQVLAAHGAPERPPLAQTPPARQMRQQP